MSAWLRYNKIAADLKKKAKEQEFEKRAVGNLYGGFKNLNNRGPALRGAPNNKYRN
jgi:hypothetical protein